MPIRLNLLAEAKAQEELRRKDPVKRVIGAGVLLVVLMLAWSSSLQVRALLAKGAANGTEAQLASRTNQYRIALENQQQVTDTKQKIASLRYMAANRFLHGSLLDALQRTTVPDVQLARLRTEHTYTRIEAVKGGTTGVDGKPVTAKPATCTERVTIALEARDTAANPGDHVTKFKQVIADSAYIKGLLGSTNEVRLASITPPITASGMKPYVSFTLECRLPEKTR